MDGKEFIQKVIFSNYHSTYICPNEIRSHDLDPNPFLSKVMLKLIYPWIKYVQVTTQIKQSPGHPSEKNELLT
jgi:hypothetical protein